MDEDDAKLVVRLLLIGLPVNEGLLPFGLGGGTGRNVVDFVPESPWARYMDEEERGTGAVTLSRGVVDDLTTDDGLVPPAFG